MLRVWDMAGRELLALPQEDVSNVLELRGHIQQHCRVSRFRIVCGSSILVDSDKLHTVMDVQLVQMPCAHTTRQHAYEMWQAAATGDLVKLQSMLENHLDPDVMADGQTPLYAASNANGTQAVHLLLEASAAVNKGGADPNETPLQVASRKGYAELVGILLGWCLCKPESVSIRR